MLETCGCYDVRLWYYLLGNTPFYWEVEPCHRISGNISSTGLRRLGSEFPGASGQSKFQGNLHLPLPLYLRRSSEAFPFQQLLKTVLDSGDVSFLKLVDLFALSFNQRDLVMIKIRIKKRILIVPFLYMKIESHTIISKLLCTSLRL